MVLQVVVLGSLHIVQGYMELQVPKTDTRKEYGPINFRGGHHIIEELVIHKQSSDLAIRRHRISLEESIPAYILAIKEDCFSTTDLALKSGSLSFFASAPVSFCYSLSSSTGKLCAHAFGHMNNIVREW